MKKGLKKLVWFAAVVIALASIAVGVKQLLPSSTSKPDIRSYSFSCTNDSDCTLVRTDCCNNNMPAQNGCMGKSDAARWANMLQNYCSQKSEACNTLYMEGSYGCVCKEKLCWTNFTSKSNGSFLYLGVPNTD